MVQVLFRPLPGTAVAVPPGAALTGEAMHELNQEWIGTHRAMGEKINVSLQRKVDVDKQERTTLYKTMKDESKHTTGTDIMKVCLNSKRPR